MTTIPPESELEDEMPELVDKEEQWIAETLERAGFSPENAAILAINHRDADWHKAVDLLKNGVDQALIVRILT